MVEFIHVVQRQEGMIAFTLCANNYLPYAGVLCESLKQFHPDWRYFVGLVDQPLSEVDYDRFGFDTIIPVDRLNIPNFSQMVENYNLVELNTAVKPYYFTYLFESYPEEDLVLYFDPDIQVFAPLDDLRNEFPTASILLIPHFSTPQKEQAGNITPEQRILQRGLYNLGFLGLKRGQATREMLAWWGEKMVRYCRVLPEKGLFVDQKWMDLVPIYFEGVAVIKNKGYDVAYWNLYENNLHWVGDQIMTGEVPLRFYHFSAYQKDAPGYVERLAAPFDPEMQGILLNLYTNYYVALKNQGLKAYQELPYAYPAKPPIIKRKLRKFKVSLLRKLNG